jgi:hypothetical protein
MGVSVESLKKTWNESVCGINEELMGKVLFHSNPSIENTPVIRDTRKIIRNLGVNILLLIYEYRINYMKQLVVSG